MTNEARQAAANATAGTTDNPTVGAVAGIAARDVVDALIDILLRLFGATDDPYRGAAFELRNDDIGEHVVKVTGRDDGGDEGWYDFHFELA